MAGAVALLMVAAVLWLPSWIQDRGMALASDALGRKLSVERVELKPWRLGLVLHGLTVAGATPQDEVQLSVERIETSLSTASLWKQAVVLSELQIQAPTLRLTRIAATQLDIDDLLQRWLAPSQPGARASTPMVLQRVALKAGRWQFADRVLGQQHELSALDFDLPWLSLRAEDANTPLQMRLSARLDGAPVTAELHGQPLASARQLQLHLKLDGADLVPWQAYAGSGLPVTIERGRLDGDVQLRYVEMDKSQPELSLAGKVALRELSLGQRGQANWLAWKALRLTVRDLQPLAQRVQLDALEIEEPQLRLQRDRRGQLRLPSATPAGKSGSAPVATPDWQVALDRLAIQGGSIGWQDEALSASAALALDGVQVQGAKLHWPLPTDAAAKGSIVLAAQLRALPQGKPGELQAQLSLDAGRLEAQGQWRDIALQTLSPYLQASIPVGLRGSTAGQWRFAAAKPLEAGALARGQLSLGELSVDALQARMSSGTELASLTRLTLDRVEVDLQARRASLGKLAVTAPQLQLRRDANGELLLPMPPARTQAAGQAESGPPWAMQLEELSIDKGRVLLSDASVQALARRSDDGLHRLQADAIQLRVGKLALDGQGAKLAAAPVRLSLQLSQPGSRRDGAAPGRLSWDGQLGTAPWSLRGQLRAERLPLYAFAPYLDRSLHLHVRRGEAGFKGQLSLDLPPQGWRGRMRGELAVDDLRLLHTREEEGRLVLGDEFLSWRELDLGGVDLALAANQAPSLQIASASLADFYARLIVDERGHFNLGELRAKPAAAAASAAPPAPTASAPTAESATPALALTIGETKVAGGTVDFSDRYIKPNYSAKLSELSGTLGRFASGDTAMAPLRLDGRIEGTGRLAIYGQLNPSGAPLLMDINADATDIELSPLSPYAGKYAGYAIERGKLSSHVHYRIDPGGQLEAQNQIILNQLTFGERIESPSATKLPVLLAVALLKDRNGVIDVNLPISGSLRDPQFSMGGLIVKIIFNLIVKALTAPFALFTGGGGPEQSQIDFAAGSASLDAAALPRLDKIATALQDRPSLNLTLTGWAQAEAERAGMRAQRLEQALQAERRRELRRQGGAQAAAQQTEAVAIAPADRPRLIAQLYKSSSLPDRPRNFLGLLKDLPVEEMEQRLLAGYEIKPEAVTQLALGRAVALRDALIARGVPQERIFLAAPKLGEAEADKPWTPRVELSLATR